MKVPTHAYSKAHFATYPPKLIEPSSQSRYFREGVLFGVWGWVEAGGGSIKVPAELRNRKGRKMAYHSRSVGGGQAIQNWRNANPPETVGWSPSCSCSAEIRFPARCWTHSPVPVQPAS